MKKESKFSLVSSFSESVQTALNARAKNIRAFLAGRQRGMATVFGYQFLVGNEMAEAKKIIPHGNASDNDGGFKEWLESEFEEIPYRTAARWMEFSQAVIEKSATVALFKGKPLALDTGKKLNSKQEKAILELIPQIMEGQGMIEFMRDCKALKEPTPAGGFRPSAEKLEAWLKENHPELSGKGWEELPPEIQREAKRALLAEPNEKPDPAQLKEAAEYTINQYRSSMMTWCEDQQNLALCSTATLRAMEEARLSLGRAIAEILKNR